MGMVTCFVGLREMTGGIVSVLEWVLMIVSTDSKLVDIGVGGPA